MPVYLQEYVLRHIPDCVFRIGIVHMLVHQQDLEAVHIHVQDPQRLPVIE